MVIRTRRSIALQVLQKLSFRITRGIENISIISRQQYGEATIKSKKERGTAISGSTDYLHRHPKIGLGDSVPVVGGGGGGGVCVSASGSDSGMS